MSRADLASRCLVQIWLSHYQDRRAGAATSHQTAGAEPSTPSSTPRGAEALRLQGTVFLLIRRRGAADAKYRLLREVGTM